MPWIEQTKKRSGKSGGPQYYLQDLSENCKEFLQRRTRSRVRLWTPYGIIDSGLQAVSRLVGKVGHDRIQSSGGRVESIAEQIREWYALGAQPIESIEIDASFDHDDYFLIKPTRVKFFHRAARKNLFHDPLPLTFVDGHRSRLIVNHLRELSSSYRASPSQQIASIVKEHEHIGADLDERDLLRASGALVSLGIQLGMYRRIGLDCPDARFQFQAYPMYPCQIEVEEHSGGFEAAHHDQHRSQRLVVLCMFHDAPQVLRGYIDVIELRELAKFFQEME